MQRTYELARPRFMWPNLHKDVKCFVKDCEICSETTSPRNLTVGKMEIHKMVKESWTSFGIDFVKIGKKSHDGMTEVLVITDMSTRYVIAVPTENETAKTVAQILYKELIAKIGHHWSC